MHLSVIIPHYNNVVLLGRCLHSLAAAQLGDDLQIVVVDDGSSDEQFRQVEALVAHSDDITLLRNTSNKGASYSRNRGLLSARGKFVWFVDSDDEVDTETLRLWWPHLKMLDDNVDLLHLGPMVQAPVERNQLYAVHRTLYPRPSSQATGSPFSVLHSPLSDILLPRTHCLDHTTYWISRKFLSRNPVIRYLEDVEILEDSIFILNLLGKAKHIVAAHDCRLYIRHSQDSSVTAGAWSKEKSARFLPCILLFFTQLSKFVVRHEELPHIVDLYHRYCYVYMRVLAVKGVPRSLYLNMFFNPVVRFGFVPRNLKERLLKNTFIHSLISLSCRLFRSSRN